MELTFEESRVLGVLLEKEKSTPEYYPMTVNGILTACNQKSARNPVVQFTEDVVVEAIDGLKKKGLVLTVSGGGSRSLKYKHNAGIVLDLETSEEAILCLLLLRGPLTPGEIKSNSGRLYEFSDLAEVQERLESLRSREDAFVTQLPKLTGQKEARCAHLLCGEIDIDSLVEEIPVIKSSHYTELEAKIEALEARIKYLEEKLKDLL
ncbi:MAG TPA: YceH family protein [Bacteroidia bacterium]